jgi:hypothetical protein
VRSARVRSARRATGPAATWPAPARSSTARSTSSTATFPPLPCPAGWPACSLARRRFRDTGTDVEASAAVVTELPARGHPGPGARRRRAGRAGRAPGRASVTAAARIRIRFRDTGADVGESAAAVTGVGPQSAAPWPATSPGGRHAPARHGKPHHDPPAQTRHTARWNATRRPRLAPLPADADEPASMEG